MTKTIVKITTKPTRCKQLEEDLKINKFNLNYEQRTILNHYIRTPVTIITGLLESQEDKIDKDVLVEIKKELNEIIEVVKNINGSRESI